MIDKRSKENLFNQEKKSIRCIYEHNNHQYIIHIHRKTIKKLKADEKDRVEDVFTLCILSNCCKEGSIEEEKCHKEVHVMEWYLEFIQVVGCHKYSSDKELNTLEYYNQYIKRNKEKDVNVVTCDKDYKLELYDEQGKLYKIKLVDIDITLGFHEYIYYYKKDPMYKRRICKLYKETKGHCKYNWNCLDIHIKKIEKNVEGIKGVPITKENKINSNNICTAKTYADIVQNNTSSSLSPSKILIPINTKEDYFCDTNIKNYDDGGGNDIINISNELNNVNSIINMYNKYGEITSSLIESKLNNETESERNNVEEYHNEKDKIKSDIVIDLNVGGVMYQTLLSTLRKYADSKLYNIFSDKNIQEIPKDKKGYYFIDRDGSTFYYVLEYLRNNKLYQNDLNTFELVVKNDLFDMAKVMKELIHFELIPITIKNK